MSGHELTIPTADGAAPARLFGQAGKPGVILYMDAFGQRPALDGMATRLADAGYMVLLPDLLYRFGAYGPFDAKTAFSEDATRAELKRMLRATTQAMTARDSESFLRALKGVGARAPFGVVGYCMGGARALTAAATHPKQIAAAASFHGGNLASEAEDSPHLGAGRIAARVYVGCAGIDQSFPPEQAARLARALREGGVDHIIENYAGTRHGWAVPDHSVYDEAGAERHWKRLLGFFEETLK